MTTYNLKNSRPYCLPCEHDRIDEFGRECPTCPERAEWNRKRVTLRSVERFRLVNPIALWPGDSLNAALAYGHYELHSWKVGRGESAYFLLERVGYDQTEHEAAYNEEREAWRRFKGAKQTAAKAA